MERFWMLLTRRLLQLIIFLSFFNNPSFADDAGPPADYLSNPARVVWEAGGFFEGKFEDGTPFNMNLPFDPPQSINRKENRTTQINGNYWYPKRFSGVCLNLERKAFDDNGFTFYASFQFEADKEIFYGIFRNNKTTVEGHWEDAKRKKKIAFSMERVFRYEGVDVFIPSRNQDVHGDSQAENKYFLFDGIRPVTGNTAIDDRVNKYISECDGDTECNNKVYVVWYSKNALSLHGSNWSYNYSAPHGYGTTTYMHFILTSSLPKIASLDYYLRKSDGCLADISRQIGSALEKKGLSGAKYGGQNLESRRFFPTPKGILFGLAKNSFKTSFMSGDAIIV